MDHRYHLLPRKDLQLLCKKHGIPANKTNVFMADALAKKRIPLSDVSVNKEAENDLFAVTPLKVITGKEKGEDGNHALFNNTPFLRRGNKKKENASSKTSHGTEGQMGASAATRSRSAKLFQDGGCDPSDETSKEVGSAVLQMTYTAKDLSGIAQLEESKSDRSAKGISAFVTQKPEEKSSTQLRSATGSLHRLEARLVGNSGTPVNGTKTTHEDTEVKRTATAAASTGAPLQPDGCKIRSCTSAANAELVQEDAGWSSTYAVSEKEDSDSNSSGTQEVTGLSHDSFSSAGRGDLQPTHFGNPVQEQTDGVWDATDADTCLGQDSEIERNQQEVNEPGKRPAPQKERYIVKVTFADEVSIMGQRSRGIEKVRLEELKTRRSDNSSATNGGGSGKPKWDSKPAVNPPFVFRATRQEENKVKRSTRATRSNSDSTGIAESTGPLKHEETKGRRAGSLESKETSADPKVKPETKTSAVPVTGSYSKPSKRPRLGFGSKVANDPKDVVDKVRSSPAGANVEVDDTFQFSATSLQEFKILELPEWAKDFKRKREDILSSKPSAVAQTPDLSSNEEAAASPAPRVSPLKRIGDKVEELLDRLQAFCWKAEVDAVAPEIEAANEVDTTMETLIR